MAATRSSTRPRKAPNRFDDDVRFFAPPRTRRRPKKKPEAAAPAHVLLTTTPPPSSVKVPGAPRGRRCRECGEPDCDCFEIEMKKWIATRKMKTTEVIETAK